MLCGVKYAFPQCALRILLELLTSPPVVASCGVRGWFTLICGHLVPSASQLMQRTQVSASFSLSPNAAGEGRVGKPKQDINASWIETCESCCPPKLQRYIR